MRKSFFIVAVVVQCVIYNLHPVFSQNIEINQADATLSTFALLNADNNTADNLGMLIPCLSPTDVMAYTPITEDSIESLAAYSANASLSGNNGAKYYYWSGSKWISIPIPSSTPDTREQVFYSQGIGNPPQRSSLNGGGSTGCANCITSISTYEGTGIDWATCREACRNLVENGFSDWRIPTLDEAVYYGSGAFNPPDGSWIADWVWTSTPRDTRVSDTPKGGNWMVFNEMNGRWGDSNYPTAFECRCVR